MKFLQNYRATPHPATLLSPAEILFSRKSKTTLPAFKPKVNDKYIRQRDTNYKQNFKRYADKRRHAASSNFQPGESVLVKQKKQNKLSSPFNPKPATVISTKGSMVRAKLGDKIVTRDSSNYKRVTTNPKEDVNRDLNNTCIRNQASMRGRRSPRVRRRPERFKDFV